MNGNKIAITIIIINTFTEVVPDWYHLCFLYGAEINRSDYGGDNLNLYATKTFYETILLMKEYMSKYTLFSRRGSAFLC